MSKFYQFRYDVLTVSVAAGLNITEDDHVENYLDTQSRNNGEPFSLDTEVFTSLADAMTRLNAFKAQYPTVTKRGNQKCGFCEIVELSDEDEDNYEIVARYATQICC